jgi:hypothetical protein
MTAKDITYLRLINQQIAAQKFKTVKKLVGYMGALQAQDYAMGKLAIGLRLKNITDKPVEKAINHGEIIRTHALRGTWHFVAAEDLWWMLNLSADKIKKQLRTRHKQLELNEKDFSRSFGIISNMMKGGKHITREEIVLRLEKEKFNITENRTSFILLQAELEGIICKGKIVNNNHAYTLMDYWIPAKKELTREEAIAKLALKYFSSHGPATVQDFVWWSGLTLTEAKAALNNIKQHLTSLGVASHTYWLTSQTHIPSNHPDSVYLLPAFDEFIISYTDRSAALAAQHLKKVISSNGIFWPVVVINGQVTGIWKRSFTKDKIAIEMGYFKPHNKIIKKQIEQSVNVIENFTGKKILLTH